MIKFMQHQQHLEIQHNILNNYYCVNFSIEEIFRICIKINIFEKVFSFLKDDFDQFIFIIFF
jgi:hypothetical protein